MIFVRGGILGEQPLVKNFVLQLNEDPLRVGVCVRAPEDQDGDVLARLPNPKVCLTTSEALVDAGAELEHTQEHGERAHWTAWFKVETNDADTPEQVAQRLATTVRAAFVGPVTKEEAHARLEARDLRGLQQPGP